MFAFGCMIAHDLELIIRMDQWRLEFDKIRILSLLSIFFNVGILCIFISLFVRDSIPKLKSVIVYLFMSTINCIYLVHLKLITVNRNIGLDFSTQLMYCSVNNITNPTTYDVSWNTSLS